MKGFLDNFSSSGREIVVGPFVVRQGPVDQGPEVIQAGAPPNPT
jgi:hypothetical protein